MGKRIIQQARGKGSFTYRVRRKAFKYRLKYPLREEQGNAIVSKLINSPAHTAPIALINLNGKVFYNPANQGLYEGQEIIIGGEEIKQGNILKLKDIPIGTRVFNVELKPGDGGKIIRAGGLSALITKKAKGEVILMSSNKREIKLNEDCRATIGIIAGQGRKIKPIVKAGKKGYMMKAKNRLWPRTSAVKFNAVDHPFGGGRGKRIKSKIAKRNSPPGKKVGTLSPRRTGRKKK